MRKRTFSRTAENVEAIVHKKERRHENSLKERHPKMKNLPEMKKNVRMRVQ